MKATTNPNQTVTKEGSIPHRFHKGITCPVMLDVDAYASVKELNGLQAPLRYKGKLMFALPGGKFILGD